MKTYGINEITINLDPICEEIQRLGFTVLKNVVSNEACNEASKKLDNICKRQSDEFGSEALASIQEQDLARLLISYDSWFLNFLNFDSVNKIIVSVLGDYHILNLQNGIINKPSKKHHQSSWHRDFPYQSWVCSRPLGLNALFCINDFTIETGGTYVLPHSHRFENFPSSEYVKKNEMPVIAPAGSVIIFDAMLYHRAGENTSLQIRRGINHLYTIPLIKQQISIPSALKETSITAPQEIRRLLGFDSVEPKSVLEWRKRRLNNSQPK